ncbi:MAG: fibronectin type III domain-containing protein, partial [Nitrospinae bacterium]|nr:fibronectin type III domain-containing protein [Nitrospinota bacterium]
SVLGLPIITPAGSRQYFTIWGLLPETQYRLYLVARDEVVHGATATTMAITQPVISEKVDFELYAGYNLITLPLKPIGNYTVGSLGNAVKDAGGQILTVQSWTPMGWQTFIPGNPATTDFPMRIGQGYFVFVTDKTTYSPNRIRVSNITGNQANISWLSDEEVTGKICYGVKGGLLSNVAFDERTEEIRDETHYVTIKGLTPDTGYWYDIISGGSRDDNNGQHYLFKTGPAASGPAASCSGRADEIGGRVLEADGITSAAGAIVYLRIEDKDGAGNSGHSAWLSGLTNSSGLWQIDVAKVRMEGLEAEFSYSTVGDNLVIEVEGGIKGRGKQTVETGQTSMPEMILK